ncbi:unnamed protein product [Darwinula stevensoni]|uniref:SH3 domain-containing protein n=1 Tax=Darwinula stevensoni TaxID=69355 RepID=A0A7R9FRE4_9CRUS|nr:unnamed protein product [Darwinula stevensoni]CAG0901258.1 unnamed protein product [Darwinula stevensoni]
MAFLCPVRIRRNKKKKSDGDGDSMRGPAMGRITGSASIETLVRVGIEKENGLSPDSKMVVLHDFTPCVDDELDVKRGTVVNVLYQENEWVYVISENNAEGFIPHSYCAPYGSQMAELALSVKHKKIPRSDHSTMEGGGVDRELHNTTVATITSTGPGGMENSDSESLGVLKAGGVNQVHDSQCSLQSGGSSQPDIHPFFKDPAGRYIVLYTFIARDENDVSVERGEFVTVLNREDPDWFWVVRSDGQEGFIPSAFVYPADIIQGSMSPSGGGGGMGLGSGGGASPGNVNNQSGLHNSPPHQYNSSSVQAEEMRFHGTELLMLYDYKAQAPDDLSVRRGDWVYADLNNQTVDGWLWAYSPKTRKYGFIPKAYARPPAMTSL